MYMDAPLVPPQSELSFKAQNSKKRKRGEFEGNQEDSFKWNDHEDNIDSSLVTQSTMPKIPDARMSSKRRRV